MSKRALQLILLAATAMAQHPASKLQQCRDMLDQALEDKNPDTRKQAVQALSLAASQNTFLERLDGMLADKDVEVRVAVVASLVDLRNRRAIPSLRKALEDEVPEVSFAAAKALWTFHEPAGKQALLATLEGEASTASGFLTRRKREALRMVHTPKTMFLFALTESMGFAPVPGLGTGVASMQGILSDPGVSGRATAALLLGNERDTRTLQALRDGLADKDASVRAASIHSLALRNDRAIEADIVPLLGDRKEAVRLRAAAAYLRLQTIPVRTRK